MSNESHNYASVSPIKFHKSLHAKTKKRDAQASLGYSADRRLCVRLGQKLISPKLCQIGLYQIQGSNSRTRLLCQHFDWCHFRAPKSTLSPQNEAPSGLIQRL